MKHSKMINWVVCFVVVLGACTFAVSEQEVKQMGNAMPDKPVVQPAKERTMLVFSLCNGFKHSSVPYWAKALDIMSEKTGAFKIVHSDDMSVFTPQSLEQFDVICLNNTTKLTPDEAQQKAILDFIKGGKGIVGIHAATDNFDEWPEGKQMMGGVFKGHPWTSGGTWAVKLDDPEHPLMKSFKGQNFKINDEIYRTESPLYSRDNQRVLMSLDMSDAVTKNAKGVRPDDMDTGITWIKPVGKGRLFYCSLGHVHAVTWNSAVLGHVLAGIQYAMGDYKVDDTPLGQPQSKLDTAVIDSLLDELKIYNWDKSRAATVKIEQLIRTHLNDSNASAVIEGRLTETLGSDITLASKDFICRQLSIIGTEQSLPTLSKMLTDKETMNIARFALEKIPGDSVDEALLQTLTETDGKEVKIGIITTLGIRKSEKAITPLSAFAGDSDEQVVMAAIQALGYMASESAADVLQVLVWTQQNSSLKVHLQDALLTCASAIAKENNSYKTASNTRNMYKGLYAQKNASLVRAAALRALVQSESPDSGKLLTAAVQDEDSVIRTAAIQILADFDDTQTLNTIASDIPNMTDTVKIQLLAALSGNPKKIGMAQALQLIKSDNPSVRIAAYRALAKIGDAAAVQTLALAATQSQERTERDAAKDALYRISGEGVDDMILKNLKKAGEANKPDPATIQYIQAAVQRPVSGAFEVLSVLALSDDRKLSSESTKAIQALAGPDQMEVLVDILISKPSAATETMVVVVGQKESNVDQRAEALLVKYSDVSDEKAKASMLRVMGKLGDPDSISLLRKETASDNSAIQEAAFRAMTDWPGTDFVEEMKAKAKTGSDAKTKILAFRAYVRMLDASANGKDRQAIVDELIAAYAMAGRSDEQKIVVSALGDHGNMAALKFVNEKMAEDALKAEAEVSLVNICEKLSERNPSAVKSVLDKLKGSKNETVKKKAAELLAGLPSLDGMVLDWKISDQLTASGKTDKALFDYAFPIEKNVSQGKWRDARRLLDKNTGIFILDRLDKAPNQAIYFKTTILAEKEMPAVLGIGSDDGVKVWLNRKLVHANHVSRPVRKDQDKVRVNLNKGPNQVLVKIVQLSGNWGFCMSVVDSNGNEIPGLHSITKLPPR